MPLDGTAWAGKAQAFFTYLAGTTPLQVEPWDHVAGVSAGDPVSFIHDERTKDLEATGAGVLGDEEFIVYTAASLVEGNVYRHDSKNYTAEEVEVDRSASATASWPNRAVLRRHAQ